MNNKFRYSASLLNLALTLLSEGALVWMMPQTGAKEVVVLFFAFVGMAGILILSKEVTYEYKDSIMTLAMLLATIFQFVFFFAFQYWFLLLLSPGSFSGFAILPVDFFLQSTLIFLFSPTVIPHTEVARVLVLINLFGSIVIIMFILQNIWHLKNRNAR